MPEDILTNEIEIAFKTDFSSIPTILKGRLLLIQDKSNKNIYYVLNKKSSLKIGTPVLIIKNAEYYNSKNESFAVCDLIDIAVTKVIKTKKINKTKDISENLIKMINTITKLYKLQPEFFLIRFKEMKRDTVIYNTMLNRYPDFEKRKYMYKCISYVEKLMNDGDRWKKATIISSNYYKVPYKELESLIQMKSSNFRL